MQSSFGNDYNYEGNIMPILNQSVHCLKYTYIHPHTPPGHTHIFTCILKNTVNQKIRSWNMDEDIFIKFSFIRCPFGFLIQAEEIHLIGFTPSYHIFFIPGVNGPCNTN